MARCEPPTTSTGCAQHGWHETFADRYPHAGGETPTALYLGTSEAFEGPIVVGVVVGG